MYKESLEELWDKIKLINICTEGVSEEERQTFKRIIAVNFPIIGKDKNSQTHKT